MANIKRESPNGDYAVLFLGESGVGKSTLIKAILNYRSYGKNFQRASQSRFSPVQSTVNQSDHQIHQGKGLTYYDMPLSACSTMRMYDTTESFNWRDLIAIPSLNAICILLKPETSPDFNHILGGLLSSFDLKSCERNIIFVITKTFERTSVVTDLKAYVENYNHRRQLKIPVKNINTFYINNGSFCILDTNGGVDDHDFNLMEKDWRNASDVCESLLKRVTMIPSVSMESSVALNMAKTILGSGHRLLMALDFLQDNVELLIYNQSNYSGNKVDPLKMEAVSTGYATSICTAAKCTTFCNISGFKKYLHKNCHIPCNCPYASTCVQFQVDNTCNHCGCDKKLHLHYPDLYIWNVEHLKLYGDGHFGDNMNVQSPIMQRLQELTDEKQAILTMVSVLGEMYTGRSVIVQNTLKQTLEKQIQWEFTQGECKADYLIQRYTAFLNWKNETTSPATYNLVKLFQELTTLRSLKHSGKLLQFEELPFDYIPAEPMEVDKNITSDKQLDDWKTKTEHDIKETVKNVSTNSKDLKLVNAEVETNINMKTCATREDEPPKSIDSSKGIPDISSPPKQAIEEICAKTDTLINRNKEADKLPKDITSDKQPDDLNTKTEHYIGETVKNFFANASNVAQLLNAEMEKNIKMLSCIALEDEPCKSTKKIPETFRDQTNENNSAQKDGLFNKYKEADKTTKSRIEGVKSSLISVGTKGMLGDMADKQSDQLRHEITSDTNKVSIVQNAQYSKEQSVSNKQANSALSIKDNATNEISTTHKLALNRNNRRNEDVRLLKSTLETESIFTFHPVMKKLSIEGALKDKLSTFSIMDIYDFVMNYIEDTVEINELAIGNENSDSVLNNNEILDHKHSSTTKAISEQTNTIVSDAHDKTADFSSKVHQPKTKTFGNKNSDSVLNNHEIPDHKYNSTTNAISEQTKTFVSDECDTTADMSSKLANVKIGTPEQSIGHINVGSGNIEPNVISDEVTNNLSAGSCDLEQDCSATTIDNIKKTIDEEALRSGIKNLISGYFQTKDSDAAADEMINVLKKMLGSPTVTIDNENSQESQQIIQGCGNLSYNPVCSYTNTEMSTETRRTEELQDIKSASNGKTKKYLPLMTTDTENMQAINGSGYGLSVETRGKPDTSTNVQEKLQAIKSSGIEKSVESYASAMNATSDTEKAGATLKVNTVKAEIINNCEIHKHPDIQKNTPNTACSSIQSGKLVETYPKTNTTATDTEKLQAMKGCGYGQSVENCAKAETRPNVQEKLQTIPPYQSSGNEKSVQYRERAETTSIEKEVTSKVNPLKAETTTRNTNCEISQDAKQKKLDMEKLALNRDCSSTKNADMSTEATNKPELEAIKSTGNGKSVPHFAMADTTTAVKENPESIKSSGNEKSAPNRVHVNTTTTDKDKSKATSKVHTMNVETTTDNTNYEMPQAEKRQMKKLEFKPTCCPTEYSAKTIEKLGQNSTASSNENIDTIGMPGPESMKTNDNKNSVHCLKMADTATSENPENYKSFGNEKSARANTITVDTESTTKNTDCKISKAVKHQTEKVAYNPTCSSTSNTGRTKKTLAQNPTCFATENTGKSTETAKLGPAAMKSTDKLAHNPTCSSTGNTGGTKETLAQNSTCFATENTGKSTETAKLGSEAIKSTNNEKSVHHLDKVDTVTTDECPEAMKSAAKSVQYSLNTNNPTTDNQNSQTAKNMFHGVQNPANTTTTSLPTNIGIYEINAEGVNPVMQKIFMLPTFPIVDQTDDIPMTRESKNIGTHEMNAGGDRPNMEKKFNLPTIPIKEQTDDTPTIRVSKNIDVHEINADGDNPLTTRVSKNIDDHEINADGDNSLTTRVSKNIDVNEINADGDNPFTQNIFNSPTIPIKEQTDNTTAIVSKNIDDHEINADGDNPITQNIFNSRAIPMKEQTDNITTIVSKNIDVHDINADGPIKKQTDVRALFDFIEPDQNLIKVPMHEKSASNSSDDTNERKADTGISQKKKRRRNKNKKMKKNKKEKTD